MPETVFGLPVHPLVVHATVVLVPTAALLLLLSAVLPRFRRWARLLTPAVAVVALALVPLSTSTGEELESQVGESPLVEQHAELGEGLLPWIVAVAVLALAIYWFERRRRFEAARGPSRVLALALAGLAIVAFVGTTVQVVLIGHSGARAAWSDVTTQSTAGADPDE